MRALRRVQRATPNFSELRVGVLDDGKKTRWIQEGPPWPSRGLLTEHVLCKRQIGKPSIEELYAQKRIIAGHLSSTMSLKVPKANNVQLFKEGYKVCFTSLCLNTP